MHDRTTPVLLGAAVSIALANVLGTFVFNVIAWLSIGAEINSLVEAYSSISANRSYFFLSVVAGIFSNLSGGYTAAKLSKHQPYMNALFAALLLMAWYLVMMSTSIQGFKFEPWTVFSWFAFPVPFALLGARMFLKQNK